MALKQTLTVEQADNLVAKFFPELCWPGFEAVEGQPPLYFGVVRPEPDPERTKIIMGWSEDLSLCSPDDLSFTLLLAEAVSRGDVESGYYEVEDDDFY